MKPSDNDNPAITFFAKDFLVWVASTFLSDGELGRVFRLLIYSVTEGGSLPTDHPIVATLEPKLVTLCTERNGDRVAIKRPVDVPRLVADRAAHRKRAQSAGRAGGRESAKARQEKFGSARPRTSRRGSRPSASAQTEGDHEQAREAHREAEREAPASLLRSSSSVLRSSFSVRHPQRDGHFSPLEDAVEQVCHAWLDAYKQPPEALTPARKASATRAVGRALGLRSSRTGELFTTEDLCAAIYGSVRPEAEGERTDRKGGIHSEIHELLLFGDRIENFIKYKRNGDEDAAAEARTRLEPE